MLLSSNITERVDKENTYAFTDCDSLEHALTLNQGSSTADRFLPHSCQCYRFWIHSPSSLRAVSSC